MPRMDLAPLRAPRRRACASCRASSPTPRSRVLPPRRPRRAALPRDRPVRRAVHRARVRQAAAAQRRRRLPRGRRDRRRRARPAGRPGRAARALGACSPTPPRRERLAAAARAAAAAARTRWDAIAARTSSSTRRCARAEASVLPEALVRSARRLSSWCGPIHDVPTSPRAAPRTGASTLGATRIASSARISHDLVVELHAPAAGDRSTLPPPSASSCWCAKALPSVRAQHVVGDAGLSRPPAPRAAKCASPISPKPNFGAESSTSCEVLDRVAHVGEAYPAPALDSRGRVCATSPPCSSSRSSSGSARP